MDRQDVDHSDVVDTDVESGPGWYNSVLELVYELEVFGGYWLDAARRLMDELDSVRRNKGVSREARLHEQSVLSRVQYTLASIFNHPKANLSEPQQDVLYALISQAMAETRDRQLAIPEELERYDTAVESVREWQSRMRAAKKFDVPKDTTATHSKDFTSVHWFGTDYRFAKGQQAACVRMLWDAWKNGTPCLSEKSIGEDAGSSSDRFRLQHVFKPMNRKTGKRQAHPAWGTMIKSNGKGMFELSPP